MKKYTKDELITFTEDKYEFKKAIRVSWGNIFKQLEENEVFPSKEMLLSLEDAAVFPFLFKNYALDIKDYDFIKKSVSRYLNTEALNNIDSGKSDFVEIDKDSKEVKEIIKKTLSGNISYSDVLKSLKEGFPVLFNETHNIALLEKILKDGYSFTYETYNEEEYDEQDVNADWICSVLLNSTDEEFDNISPELAVKVAPYLIGRAYDSDKVKARRMRTSFLEKYYNNAQDLNWYDEILKENLAQVSTKTAYKAIEKAFKNFLRENIENGLIFNLKGDTISFFKDKLDLKHINKITGNRFVQLWSIDDFAVPKNKEAFLNESFYGKNNLYPKKDFFQVLPRGFESGFNKEDAVALFSKMQSSTKFHSVEMEDNGVIFLCHLINTVYPGDERLKDFNVTEFACNLLVTGNHSHVYTDAKLALINMTLKMLTVNDLDNFKDGANFFEVVSRNNYLKRDKEIGIQINRFFAPEKASLDKAVLFLFEDLRFIDSEVKNKFLNNLHPLDLRILRECGLQVDISVKGNSYQTPADISNSYLYKKDIIANYNWDYLLRSPTYVDRINVNEFVYNRDVAKILGTKIARSQSSSGVVTLLKKSLSNNPDYLPTFENEDKEYLDAFYKNKDLRNLVPEKKYINYEEYIKNVQIIYQYEVTLDEIRDDLINNSNDKYNTYNYSNAPEYQAVSNKKSSFSEKIKNIPRDIVLKFYEEYVKRKDWEKYYIEEHKEDNVLHFLLKKDINKNLSKTDLDNAFKAILPRRNLWGKDFKNLKPRDVNQGIARVILSFYKHKQNGSGYQTYYEHCKHLFEDRTSRGVIVDVLKREYPEMIITGAFFNLTHEIPNKERINLLKEGLSKATMKQKAWVLTSERLEPKNIIEPVILDYDFCQKLKNEELSIEDKLVLMKIIKKSILKTQFPSTEVLKNLIDAGVEIEPKREEVILREKTIDAGSSLILFNEFLKDSYIEENIEKIAKFSQETSATWKYSLSYLLPTREEKLLYIILDRGEFMDEAVNKIKFKNNFKDDFLAGFRGFLESKEDYNNITDYVSLNDNNFDVVMDSLLDSKLFKHENYYMAGDTKGDKAFKKLLKEGFISENLSLENKEVLFNAVKMSLLSDKFLDGDVFGYKKSILTSPDVVELADVFGKKNEIDNIFSKFDENTLIDCEDDDNDNDVSLSI